MSDPVLTPIPHEQFVADVRALAAALRAGDWTPDFLVGIGRGGLAPCTYLSHATHLPMLSVDYSSGVEDFSQALLARLAARTRDGERLLFVDDINDTGGTIARLREGLAAAGADLAQVRFAVLIDNEVSKARVDYRARRIDRTVTKDWFVFPWEALASTADVVRDAQLVPERTA
jgi:hypoxanthine phosphoribosyltransferase